MLGVIGRFKEIFKKKSFQITCPKVIQTLSEKTLLELVPNYDGWIIGDDPVTKSVLKAGANGNLKAAVKWGIGTDNIDYDAARLYGIPVKNTPNMFGNEVADIAMAYMVGLARNLFYIDREVRKSGWPKPLGVSLHNKTVAILGYGNIGKEAARRMVTARMHVIAYDPVIKGTGMVQGIEVAKWPERSEEWDYIVLTCALNDETYHIIDEDLLARTKKGVKIINVARGKLVDENAMLKYLKMGWIEAAALDVFEDEPLPVCSELRQYENCVFGSHNSSNTIEGVLRASEKSIELLFEMLER